MVKPETETTERPYLYGKENTCHLSVNEKLSLGKVKTPQSIITDWNGGGVGIPAWL